MGKKKQFIDRKKAATFQLISRDSSDPNYSEGPNGDRVFVRVDGNSETPFFDEKNSEDDGIFDDAPEDSVSEEKETTAERLPRGSSLPDHVRREIVELGFPDDGYNYLSHLREIRVSGGVSSFYQNPNFDQLPPDVKAYDASRIEVSKANDEESYKKEIYGVAVKTVPVRIQKAVDPDIAALLDDSDDSRFGSDVEDLDEDFVLNANLPDESEIVEFDKKLDSKEYEYVMNYSKENVVERSETLVGEKARERRPLDEQFDLLELQEYGSDSEDEFENATSEDYEVHESLSEKINPVDPDIAALLDDSDDSRFGSDVEDLDEDFVLNANLPDESEIVEFDKKLDSKEYEYVMNYSKENVVERSETLVGEKARERRPLDEQFDLLELQEYGSDSEDEFENATSEDYEVHESLSEKINPVPLEMEGNFKLLVSDKNIEEEPVSLETAADLRPRCMEYAEQFENENANDKEDVIMEESSDESEAWDCETIITTYSNLDNHPGKIEAPGGRRKKRLTETVNKAFTAPTQVITLKGRDKIPLDFLPGRGSATEVVKDKSKPSNVQQPKKMVGQESKEEKKERKAAIKEEKREARRNKKDLKELYKSEGQQAQKVAAFSGPSSIHLM